MPLGGVAGRACAVPPDGAEEAALWRTPSFSRQDLVDGRADYGRQRRGARCGQPPERIRLLICQRDLGTNHAMMISTTTTMMQDLDEERPWRRGCLGPCGALATGIAAAHHRRNRQLLLDWREERTDLPSITYFGRISYSTNLWHWPVAVIVTHWCTAQASACS